MSCHAGLRSFRLTEAELATLSVLGIAGNFAEHLIQAGEASDFIHIATESDRAPKGLFPIYLPGFSNFLGVYPLSHHVIAADFAEQPRLQMEPELAVLFAVSYDEEGRVTTVTPQAFTAFNDCSNRINAPKISLKKNWGNASTGIGQDWFELDELSEQGCLQDYVIACSLARAGLVTAYGQTTPVKHYSYWNQALLEWLINQLNSQRDQGPLEDMPAILAKLAQPKQLIISLGATRYTAFGEACYLQPGDRLHIGILPSSVAEQGQWMSANARESLLEQGGICLTQQVRQLDSNKD